MSMQDTLGDTLTRIRNAQMSKLVNVKILCSKMNKNLLDVLKEEGYINGYHIDNSSNVPYIKVDLKYSSTGSPVIREIKRVSKPGKRIYKGIRKLSKHYNGLGVTILSTSRGIKSDRVAREEHVGGEVICMLF